jgi:hypothetical protein
MNRDQLERELSQLLSLEMRVRPLREVTPLFVRDNNVRDAISIATSSELDQASGPLSLPLEVYFQDEGTITVLIDGIDCTDTANTTWEAGIHTLWLYAYQRASGLLPIERLKELARALLFESTVV